MFYANALLWKLTCDDENRYANVVLVKIYIHKLYITRFALMRYHSE